MFISASLSAPSLGKNSHVFTTTKTHSNCTCCDWIHMHKGAVPYGKYAYYMLVLGTNLLKQDH